MSRNIPALNYQGIFKGMLFLYKRTRQSSPVLQTKALHSQTSIILYLNCKYSTYGEVCNLRRKLFINVKIIDHLLLQNELKSKAFETLTKWSLKHYLAQYTTAVTKNLSLSISLYHSLTLHKPILCFSFSWSLSTNIDNYEENQV